MLITIRMTLILYSRGLKNPLFLFMAPSWLLIFSATSLIMPAGYPVLFFFSFPRSISSRRCNDRLPGDDRVIVIKRRTRYIDAVQFGLVQFCSNIIFLNEKDFEGIKIKICFNTIDVENGSIQENRFKPCIMI